MPLEISEIGVRLSVGDAAPQSAPDAARAPSAGRAAPLTRDQMDEIVRACVIETLTLIRRSEGR